MKKLLITCFAIICSLLIKSNVIAEEAKEIGKISLIATLPEEYSPQINALLINKLNQIATQNGLAGNGFDNRFIISARLLPINFENTATIPAMVSVKLNVSFFIGDSLDSTLYSSWETEVKGIGKDKTDAYLNAVRRINPANKDIQNFVKKGCNRITSYYEKMSSDIINSAIALAQSGKYDQAVNTLLTIPSTCKAYEEAQKLISEYGSPAIENYNIELLNQARAAWSTSPTESGALEAYRILCKIKYPSEKIQSQVQELSKVMYDSMQKNRLQSMQPNNNPNQDEQQTNNNE